MLSSLRGTDLVPLSEEGATRLKFLYNLSRDAKTCVSTGDFMPATTFINKTKSNQFSSSSLYWHIFFYTHSCVT